MIRAVESKSDHLAIQALEANPLIQTNPKTLWQRWEDLMSSRSVLVIGPIFADFLLGGGISFRPPEKSGISIPIRFPREVMRFSRWHLPA